MHPRGRRDRDRGLTKQLETAVQGGTRADIAAAGAHELLRRGGMIPVASGTGRELEPFTNEPLTGFDVTIEARPGDLVRTWIYGPVRQGYWLGGYARCASRPGIRRARLHRPQR